ncbi:unnamed protein product, partial [Bemisia tabaci]
MRTITFADKNGTSKSARKRRALILDQSEWQQLEKPIADGEERRRRIQREEENKRVQAEERKKMLANYKLLISGLGRIRDEKQKQLLEKQEKEKEERYKRIREEEELLKKIAVEKARQLAKLEKDEMKTLTSALRFAEVLRERQAQMEFDRTVKAREEKKKKEEAEKRRKEAEDYKLELAKKKIEMKEKAERENEAIKQRFKEYQQMRKEEDERRLAEELDEIHLIQTELKQKQEEENARAAERKKALIACCDENRKMMENRINMTEEDENAKEAAVLEQARTKQERAREWRQLEIKKVQDKVAIAERMYEMAATAQTSRDEFNEEEEERIRTAKLIKELQKEEERRGHRKKLADEKKQMFADYLKETEWKREMERARLKEEMMERRLKEISNARIDNETRKDTFEKAKLCRENWDEQCVENMNLRMMEKKLDKRAVDRSVHMWKMSDEEYFKYAREVVEDSQKWNRPLLPILKSIEDYKRRLQLTPLKPQHRLWKSNVPIESVTLHKVGAPTSDRIQSTSSGTQVFSASEQDGTALSRFQVSSCEKAPSKV